LSGGSGAGLPGEPGGGSGAEPWAGLSGGSGAGLPGEPGGGSGAEPWGGLSGGSGAVVSGGARGSGFGSFVLVGWVGQRILRCCVASCFDAGYLGRFGGYLMTALAAMAADPDAPLVDAELLSAAERHHLLVERAGPARSLVTEPVHQLIA